MYPRIFQFKKPPETPPKDYPFNCDTFAKSVNDNVLTRAIRSQFVKGGALNAAWEYFTLKRSFDSYQALMGNGAKVYTISSVFNNFYFFYFYMLSSYILKMFILSVSISGVNNNSSSFFFRNMYSTNTPSRTLN